MACRLSEDAHAEVDQFLKAPSPAIAQACRSASPGDVLSPMSGSPMIDDDVLELSDASPTMHESLKSGRQATKNILHTVVFFFVLLNVVCGALDHTASEGFKALAPSFTALIVGFCLYLEPKQGIEV